MKNLIIFVVTSVLFIHVSFAQSINNETKEQFNRAVDFIMRNDSGEAILVLDSVIQKAPHFAKAYLERGKLLFMMDSTEKAHKDLSRALFINNEMGEANFYRGYINYKNNRPDSAIKELTIALENNYRNPEVYYVRGLANYELEDYNSA